MGDEHVRPLVVGAGEEDPVGRHERAVPLDVLDRRRQVAGVERDHGEHHQRRGEQRGVPGVLRGGERGAGRAGRLLDPPFLQQDPRLHEGGQQLPGDDGGRPAAHPAQHALGLVELAQPGVQVREQQLRVRAQVVRRHASRGLAGQLQRDARLSGVTGDRREDGQRGGQHVVRRSVVGAHDLLGQLTGAAPVVPEQRHQPGDLHPRHEIGGQVWFAEQCVGDLDRLAVLLGQHRRDRHAVPQLGRARRGHLTRQRLPRQLLCRGEPARRGQRPHRGHRPAHQRRRGLVGELQRPHRELGGGVRCLPQHGFRRRGQAVDRPHVTTLGTVQQVPGGHDGGVPAPQQHVAGLAVQRAPHGCGHRVGDQPPEQLVPERQPVLVHGHHPGGDDLVQRRQQDRGAGGEQLGDVTGFEPPAEHGRDLQEVPGLAAQRGDPVPEQRFRLARGAVGAQRGVCRGDDDLTVVAQCRDEADERGGVALGGRGQRAQVVVGSPTGEVGDELRDHVVGQRAQLDAGRGAGECGEQAVGALAAAPGEQPDHLLLLEGGEQCAQRGEGARLGQVEVVEHHQRGPVRFAFGQARQQERLVQLVPRGHDREAAACGQCGRLRQQPGLPGARRTVDQHHAGTRVQHTAEELPFPFAAAEHPVPIPRQPIFLSLRGGGGQTPYDHAEPHHASPGAARLVRLADQTAPLVAASTHSSSCLADHTGEHPVETSIAHLPLPGQVARFLLASFLLILSPTAAERSWKTG
ncbi:hypothetical protein [Lentzea guizhouensis]|uniref:hypothetical protein n=1 Tax=Lentzea guizhouensis TaxID=1586287 RepID=UPI0012B69981|nr:hypothetical protein [Lentzea guizhouensis]